MQKLHTVVVSNEYGGVVSSLEEEGIVSGEIIVMQKIYRIVDKYLAEETRYARLHDDICRLIQLNLSPGTILPGHIVLKQRTSFAEGYVKMKGIGNRLLRDKNNIPIWGRTYYTTDQEDKDELIESLSGL